MNSLIKWFSANPIAANLLMILVLIAGAMSLNGTDKEVFPGALVNQIEISMAYPGAGPREVEEQICIRIEEAVASLDGIKEITSVARQGTGSVVIEVASGYDTQRLLNNVKTKIDAINTFPVDAERPLVNERLFTSELMSLAMYGDVDERLLKDTSQWVRDEISVLPGVSLVEVDATRTDEVAVEIRENALRRYGLTFEQVVSAIQKTSVNLPAGVIKSSHGDIQIQARGQAYDGDAFGQTVVLSRPDGAAVLLRDVATITDGFSETDVIARYNGLPAVFVELYVTENPNVLQTSESVRQYLTGLPQRLPQGISVDISRDWSEVFSARLKLLSSNAVSGLLLVFVVLMLFLRPALAIWVCAGITVAFAGAMWLMPALGVSFNMLSLFAFLLILGIVVDDAIIVSESIYTRQQKGATGIASAQDGALKVAGPVFFAVVSTMIFFVPMLFIPNTLGDIVYPIPVIVISCLLFSLVESMLILPSHLAHLKPERAPGSKPALWLSLARQRCAEGLQHAASHWYGPFIRRCLHDVRLPIAGFFALFLVAMSIYGAGWIRQSFMPQVPSDFLHARIQLEEGVPFSRAQALLEKVEQAAAALKTDATLIAAIDGNPAFIRSVESWASPQNVRVRLALMDAETRAVGSPQVARRWRELIGELPEAKEFDVGFTINARDKAIRLRVGINENTLERQRQALDAVKAALAAYPGVNEVKDSLQSARDEIELTLLPNAELLGLGLQDVARQVRQGFYGAEAQRVPRGKEDVRVMVRYPRAERESVDSLYDMRIRTQSGDEVPFETVAQGEYVAGYTVINRVDRQRANSVTAELDSSDSGQAFAIVNAVLAEHGDTWRREFPGFRLEVAGDMKAQNEFMQELVRDFFLSLLVIYALMAIAFRSYGQPLLIMSAIPFGFMGAVFGHLLLGREISMLSMLGFLACAGVVVNDNLVLIDRINQLRARGMAVLEAVAQAGRDRFRAIVLTSLTTFIGLVPIMAETSVQARFLIPMVISLAFGVLLASTVTLVLVPCLYVAGVNLKRRAQALLAR
ncbi:efflux RND transporter permease subunit [Simiduia agarivorans]|uniref:Acriflavin resistance protein n=1 Tax=Simiduia agarivorans (strain DSM 21679 / JCM 13881 / BCRC 17597 / SA1) TaxID=1117647 RepID=K4KNU7_SIMAS|nr:efflux RND transporter permease subunit [Simiduia agarivorans]AFU99783.1 acriflavin resistance protein [Simiduia agarivorans SA1 = DSM 21679]